MRTSNDTESHGDPDAAGAISASAQDAIRLARSGGVASRVYCRDDGVPSIRKRVSECNGRAGCLVVGRYPPYDLGPAEEITKKGGAPSPNTTL